MSHRTTAKSKHRSGTISTDKLVVGALTLTTLVTGGIMSSMHVNADDGNNAVVDDTTIIVPTTCSMSGTINEGDEHTATILPGSYKDNIGKTDIKALCNDYNGFSIYAIGYSNNTSGTPTDGTNTMIGQTTGSTIATGTNDSGDTSNWAMKLTKISDTTITYNPNNLSISGGYDSYNVIPSTLTKVVEYKDTNTNNSSSTDQTKGAHIETTYAAYIASTQPADTYNGKVKYLLVHPANFTTGTYSIAYNANGGTGTMEETNIPNYEPHTLAASTLTAPAGYMLAGWCDTQDNTASGVVQGADPQTTCAGTSYADQATIPASTVASGSSLTLYAYWKLPRTMQNVSTWKNSLSTGETITVTDERDDKEYTVAKLADGKVWMTRNLDLQKEDLKAGVTLNSDNTDHPASGFVLPDSQKSGSDDWYNYPNTEASTNTAHVYDLNDNGETYHYCVEYKPWGECETYGDEVIPSEDLGNYYNWYSATAGTGTYSMTNNQVATGSICPAGWRLPNGATSESTATDYSTLLHAYGVIDSATYPYHADSSKIASIFESPLSLVRAGYYSVGVDTVGANGSFWSSMASDYGHAHHFYFSGTGVRPWGDAGKYGGDSVRCVAE